MGRRGAFLLLFSTAFVVIAINLLNPISTVRTTLFLHEYIPTMIRFFIWFIPAIVGYVCTFLRKPGQDIIGFVFLCLPVAERAVSYILGIIMGSLYEEFDDLVGPGFSGSIVYLSMLGSIMIVASWPDPRSEIIEPLFKRGT